MQKNESRREYHRKHYAKNKEKLAAYQREWRAANPGRHEEYVAAGKTRSSDPTRRAYQQKWRDQNRERQRENCRAWRLENRESYLERQKVNAVDRRAKRRRQAIEKLGGCCAHCGFEDERALQFDHKTPLRRREKNLRQLGGTLSATEFNAILNSGNHDIQLLCANCHAIKTAGDRAAGWLAASSSATEKLNESACGHSGGR